MAWPRGRLRPGIGSLKFLPAWLGASAVQATSTSASCEIAREAPVSTDLNRSRGVSSAIAALDRLPRFRPIGEEALDALVGQHVLEQPPDHRRRRGHDVGADLRRLE